MTATDKPKIATIVTCFYPHSHADVILPKFVKGFPTDQDLEPPQVQLVSMYLDQRHERDVGVGFAKRNNISLYSSIRGALTLGGKHLAVDGVLLIGEHGDYPENELGQAIYPRKCFFEQICAVIAAAARAGWEQAVKQTSSPQVRSHFQFETPQYFTSQPML